jgi:hypothetical protein
LLCACPPSAQLKEGFGWGFYRSLFAAYQSLGSIDVRGAGFF